MQLAQIQEEIDVRAPLWLAYEQWTQFELFPRFMEHLVSVERREEARVLLTADIGGRHRSIETAIEEQRPDRLIRWDCSDGLESHGQILFDSLEPELTRVIVDVIWDPRERSEHTVSLFRLDPLSVQQDLASFRAFIEQRHEERKRARAHASQEHNPDGQSPGRRPSEEPGEEGRARNLPSTTRQAKPPSGTLPHDIGSASQDALERHSAQEMSITL